MELLPVSLALLESLRVFPLGFVPLAAGGGLLAFALRSRSRRYLRWDEELSLPPLLSSDSLWVEASDRDDRDERDLELASSDTKDFLPTEASLLYSSSSVDCCDWSSLTASAYEGGRLFRASLPLLMGRDRDVITFSWKWSGSSSSR